MSCVKCGFLKDLCVLVLSDAILCASSLICCSAAPSKTWWCVQKTSAAKRPGTTAGRHYAQLWSRFCLCWVEKRARHKRLETSLQSCRPVYVMKPWPSNFVTQSFKIYNSASSTWSTCEEKSWLGCLQPNVSKCEASRHGSWFSFKEQQVTGIRLGRIFEPLQ